MSSTGAAANAAAPVLQVYEYMNIDNGIELTPGHAMFFAESPCWIKCGIETSRQLSQTTTLGQEVTLTLNSMISCKYVLKYNDGANYKFLAHKYETKSDAPRVLCRPLRCFDFSITVAGVDDVSKTWTGIVHDVQNQKSEEISFEFGHNVGYVRSEVRRLMLRKKANDEVLIHEFILPGGEHVNGRCNALKLLRGPVESKSKAKVIKRPAGMKTLNKFKKSQKWNKD